MVNSIGSPGQTVAPSTVPSTSGTVAPQEAGAGNQSAASAAALAQGLTSGLVATGPLGLSRGVNPEDSSAILAEAELALDRTGGEGRRNRILNNYAQGRDALQGFAGFIDGKQRAVAKDGAATAAADRTKGDLDETKAGQTVEGAALAEAGRANDAALALLDGGAPDGEVSGATYVADLKAGQDLLKGAAASITRENGTAEAAAVASRTAGLTGQIADVDARIAEATAAGYTEVVAGLQATRASLAADLASVATDVKAQFDAVLEDSLTSLDAGIATFDDLIQRADPSKPASRAAYAAAKGAVADAVAGLAEQVADLGRAAEAVAAGFASVGRDIAALAADIVTQSGSVAPQALTLIPVFSQIATDVFGGGAHARDVTKAKALDRGFEDLEGTARTFREKDARRSAEDAQQRTRQGDAVDADRVAALAAGLVAGLADLRAVVRQENAGSQDRTADAGGGRFRLSL